MLRNKGIKTSIKKVVNAKLIEGTLAVLGAMMALAYMCSVELRLGELSDAIEPMKDRVKLHDDLEKDYGFMMEDNEALETLLENAK